MKAPFTGVCAYDHSALPTGYESAVSGTTLYLTWTDLEATNMGGTLNGAGLAKITTMINNAAAGGFYWRLRLFTNGPEPGAGGVGYPSWMTGVGVPLFRHLNTQEDPWTDAAHVFLAYWDSAYKPYYERLVTALGVLLDGEATCREVVVGGAMLLYAEPFILDLGGAVAEANISEMIGSSANGGAPGWGTGTPANTSRLTIAGSGAGFTDAKYQAALSDFFDYHSAAFPNTPQALAFNPYQTLNANGSVTFESVSAAKTISVGETFCTKLGPERAVLSNTSIGPDRAVWQNGVPVSLVNTNYGNMYAWMRNCLYVGKAVSVFLQTQNTTVILNPVTQPFTTVASAMDAAEKVATQLVGCAGLEPQPPSMTPFTLATVARWDTELNANYPARGSSMWTPQYAVRTRGQGTLSRTATMQVSKIWDTQAHAVQVAKECVFISGPFSMPYMAAMMTANPQLIFAPYLKSIQNPNGTGDYDAAGTKYPNAWYAHHKNGVKAAQGGKYRNWVMESGYYTETHVTKTQIGPLSNSSITASSWAEFHVKDSVAKINQINAQAAQGGTHPFRGLWYDSNDTFSADGTGGTGGSGAFWAPPAGTSTNPGWDPHLLSAYTKPNFVAMAHWVGDMSQNLTSAGAVNAERLWTAANGLRSTSIADHYDMAMAEGWMVAGGIGGAMTGGAGPWDNRVDLALTCQAKGCIAELYDWGLGGDTLAIVRQKRRFFAASYLIANRGLVTMEFHTLKLDRPDLESALDVALYGDTSTGGSNAPLDLGSPLSSPATAAGHAVAVGTGNGQASAAGLRARLFDGGTVLVNPTAGAINYKASKTYTLVPEPGFASASYVAGNLIPVLAGHGVILTTTGGTGGTTPTITLDPYVLGTPREGQTLYLQPGVYAGSPAPTLTRQWQLSATGVGSWSNVTGATGNNYTIPVGSGGTPATYATDAFARTVATGWGSADTGGAWAVEQGSAVDYDVASGRGEMSMSTANTGKQTSLNVGQSDIDAVVTVSFPSVAAGGNLHASLNLRFADTSNYYRVNVIDFVSGGHVFANPDKVIAGVATSLGTAKDLGTYTAGAGVKIRLRLSGSTVMAKAWLASGSEPGSWDWSVTDSAITAAGKLVLRGFRGSANTNTSPQVRFDDLTASALVGTTSGIAGEYLRVVETATNSAGAVSANSAATAVIATGAASDPAWTVPPSVSGTPSTGATLTATPGTITGTPAPTVTYQWQSSATGAGGSWSNISGETAITYDVASGLSGDYVRVVVTATNTGAAPTMPSRETAQIIGGDTAPSFSADPTLSGTIEAGQTHTLTRGTAAGSPAPSITDQWQSSADSGATWQAISGQVGTTYPITTTDVGHLIRVVETATNRAGSAQAASTPAGPVTTPSGFPNLVLQVAVE